MTGGLDMETESKDTQAKQVAPDAFGDGKNEKPEGVHPKVDIYETKDRMVLIADMPGVDETSVDIMLEKNVLTITGSVDPVHRKDIRWPTRNTIREIISEPSRFPMRSIEKRLMPR